MALHGHESANVATDAENRLLARIHRDPDIVFPDPESRWPAYAAGGDHGPDVGGVLPPARCAPGLATPTRFDGSTRSPYALDTEIPEAGFDDDFDDDDDDDLDDEDDDFGDDDDDDLDDDFDDDLG